MDRREYLKEYRKEYKDRTKRVSLTFSNGEYSAFEKAAKASGMKPASFIKSMADQSLHNQIKLPDDIEERLDAISRLARSVANNMNQIARHSNRVRKVLDENEPLIELQKLDQSLRAEIEMLARQGRGA